MIRIINHPEDIIEVNQEIIDEMKRKLQEPKKESKWFFNTLEDCRDIVE